MDGSQDLTDIQRFYKNTTVFLTGATGFIGKLVLEKILRALPVKKVFILVRKKKEAPAVKRFQDIFESPVFDLLKRTKIDVLQKVIIMEGDCSLPMLGMSEEDIHTFVQEVNVIFHPAANVRFDQTIKKAVFTNIRGTKELITLSKQIKSLKTFIYVGTGFSNCNKSEIKEEIYPSKILAEKLISVCENLDEESLNCATKTLIGDWPNTYTFSKQVIEDYINREARGLPIGIVRPAIVVSTNSEPVSAFIDNVFTLAGFVVANALGISKITYYQNTVLDIIPADYVVNACIAAGWQVGELYKPYKAEIPVYNLTTSRDNPVTQDQIYSNIDFYARQIPTSRIIIFPLYFRTKCKYNYLFWRIFLHSLAAHIIDLVLKIKGEEPKFADAIAKLHKFQEAYEFFTTRSILFHVENTNRILRKMSFKDRELFNFDVTTINWEQYFSQYTKGLRFYLLKDTNDTIPEGKKHYNRLRNSLTVGMIIFTVLFYALVKFFLFRVLSVIFGFILYILRDVIC